MDTAGTIRAADALKKGEMLNAYCTHSVLSGEAVSRVEKSVDQLVVTDTIPLTEEGSNLKN